MTRERRSLGPFEVTGELGEGGSGKVYAVVRDGQSLALKVLRDDLALPPGERRRFPREAEMHASCRARGDGASGRCGDARGRTALPGDAARRRRDARRSSRARSPRPCDGPSISSLRGIQKNFGGVKALRDGNLEIDGGEIHLLMGENGAGKSTLMKIVAGMLQKDGGEMLWQGRSVSFALPAEASANGIAMVHQESLLAGHLTVAENIFLGRETDRARPHQPQEHL